MSNESKDREQAGLKIGILAADLTHRNGWAHYSLSLIEALRQAGARITVVAARNSPPLEGVRVLPILPTLAPIQRGMLAGTLRALPQARAALRDCDLIHAAVEPYAPLGGLIAAGRPLIVTGHGTYVLAAERRRFPVNRIYGWAYRRATMVCVSHYTAQRLEASLPGVRTVVVNNGVDFARFGGIAHVGGGGVLSVGAVKARKGTVELVRALTRVPGARGVIVGSVTAEPEYAARVKGEIERLGVQERVILTGQIGDAELMRRYAEADVGALPSLNVGWKFEGYGLTLLEASAAGVPVIGTRGCGAEDAVIEGVTGLLVAQDDLETGLAAAISRLLAERDLAARMGAAGRDHARGQTWERVAEKMNEVYKAAVSD